MLLLSYRILWRYTIKENISLLFFFFSLPISETYFIGVNLYEVVIRKAELILGAIEFVQAQGVKKRTEIHPKYKEKIEWNEVGDNSSTVPFEMHIPKEIRRSWRIF
jgi:hypothetical protein